MSPDTGRPEGSYTRDYYELLGVGRKATNKEIKVAFHSLARKFHPDVNSDKDAEEKFKEINEAYGVLNDAEKRRLYDMSSHEKSVATATPAAKPAAEEAEKLKQKALGEKKGREIANSVFDSFTRSQLRSTLAVILEKRMSHGAPPGKNDEDNLLREIDSSTTEELKNKFGPYFRGEKPDPVLDLENLRQARKKIKGEEWLSGSEDYLQGAKSSWREVERKLGHDLRTEDKILYWFIPLTKEEQVLQDIKRKKVIERMAADEARRLNDLGKDENDSTLATLRNWVSEQKGFMQFIKSREQTETETEVILQAAREADESYVPGKYVKLWEGYKKVWGYRWERELPRLANLGTARNLVKLWEDKNMIDVPEVGDEVITSELRGSQVHREGWAEKDERMGEYTAAFKKNWEKLNTKDGLK